MTPERTEISVTLHGGAPWGFRISGGKEFHQPLVVSRVTPGSVSSKAGIQAGDVVLAIDGEYVSGLRQDQFEEKLAMATDSVMLVIEKNGGPQRGKNNNSGGLSDIERMVRHNRSAQPFPGSKALQNSPATSKPATSGFPAGFRPISFNPTKK